MATREIPSSKEIVCDRCGVMAIDKGLAGTLGTAFHRSLRGSYKHNVGIYIDERPVSFDLCGTCAESFFAWKQPPARPEGDPMLTNSCRYCGGPWLTNGVNHNPGCPTQARLTADGTGDSLLKGIQEAEARERQRIESQLRQIEATKSEIECLSAANRQGRLDLFAAAALTGLLAHPYQLTASPVVLAVDYARQTLAALDKEEQK